MFEIFTPFSCPLFQAYLVIILKPFATNNDRNRDKEHPYCSPIEAVNKPKGEPLINTRKEVEKRNPMI